MSTTTVRLQPEVEQALDAMAAQSRRSRSWLINEALRTYIAQQKTIDARWRETLQAIESVAQGKAVSGDAVHAWLDSWGSEHEHRPPQADG